MSRRVRAWEPFDACEYMGAPPVPPDREVMPLAEFPDDRRIEIGCLVQEPRPPERYIELGVHYGRPTAIIESRAWYEWHWLRGIDPALKRRSLSATKRSRVIERDGHRCALCGDDVEPDDIHIDHIVPVSKGGSDHLDNLQVTHSRCNLRKGAG